MVICQMLLLQLRFNIYSVLNDKNPYMSTWFDLSTYYDWCHQQSVMALLTVPFKPTHPLPLHFLQIMCSVHIYGQIKHYSLTLSWPL